MVQFHSARKNSRTPGSLTGQPLEAKAAAVTRRPFSLSYMSVHGFGTSKTILDAGFPAAKPVRDHDLFGIPTLEELIAAVEQLRPEFRLSVRRINPDEVEAHSGFVTIDGEVTYWARHGSTATEALAKLWLALHAVQ